MITIILNHHNKYAEIDMPVMYEELQLALWKLGLDRVPEKYTLQDLEATFRYLSPLEYFVLRLLEGEMNLLDAVSAIYTVIAPPRPIMAQVQILSSGFRSITELRQEIDRMIKSSAQFGSTCFFPVRGWLVGLDGEMEPARDAVMLQNAEVIGEAVQRMQSWIIHDMALCFADTETDAEESLFQKILSARWSVEKRGRKLYGRNAFAKYQLGKLLCQGELVLKDIARGLPLLEELAENGVTFGSYIAGKVYLKEEGWQDIKKAILYFRQAAEDGNSFAEYQLGRIYYFGNGVRVDQEKGLEYLKESAAHGNEYAANLLFTIQQQHTWGVASCTASLIAQLGRIFQEQDQKQSQHQRPRMDRKHRREIEEKKQAMGIRD